MKGSDCHLVIFPIIHQNMSIGVIEIATFSKIDENNEEILNSFSELVSDLVEGFR